MKNLTREQELKQLITQKDIELIYTNQKITALDLEVISLREKVTALEVTKNA